MRSSRSVVPMASASPEARTTPCRSMSRLSSVPGRRAIAATSGSTACIAAARVVAPAATASKLRASAFCAAAWLRISVRLSSRSISM